MGTHESIPTLFREQAGAIQSHDSCSIVHIRPPAPFYTPALEITRLQGFGPIPSSKGRCELAAWKSIGMSRNPRLILTDAPK